MNETYEQKKKKQLDRLEQYAKEKQSLSCIESAIIIEQLALEEGKRIGYEDAKKVFRGENITDDICRHYKAQGIAEVVAEIDKIIVEYKSLCKESEGHVMSGYLGSLEALYELKTIISK